MTTTGIPNLAKPEKYLNGIYDFFAMTTLFAAYSAQMTAVLSVFNVVMPFENVQGMYRDTEFKVGSVKNTAFDNLFNVSLGFLENILSA